MLRGGKHIVNTYNLLVVIFVALGTLSTAYGLAIIGSTVGQPNCRQPGFPNGTVSNGSSLHVLRPRAPGRARLCAHDEHHRRFVLVELLGCLRLTFGTALNGVNSAGAILGCLTSAWTADKYSRKRTIQLGCLILIVGGALCAGSVSIGMCKCWLAIVVGEPSLTPRGSPRGKSDCWHRRWHLSSRGPDESTPDSTADGKTPTDFSAGTKAKSLLRRLAAR